ncbi:hypothetical protein [Marinicellulosiphila megalodicopiae]|uniref:hypothetical protein n=1 Tax=Marinicellulosiphila megalodicopiae TaxID=2724896 RepID=UPI003BB21E2C
MNNERRQGPDFWIKSLPIFNMVAWGLFILTMALTHIAQPEMDTGIVRYHELEIREHWLMPIVFWIQITLLGMIMLLFGNIVVAKNRTRRKCDQQYLNQWLLLVLTLFSVLMLFIFTR